jgi:hypothetical protein
MMSRTGDEAGATPIRHADENLALLRDAMCGMDSKPTIARTWRQRAQIAVTYGVSLHA